MLFGAGAIVRPAHASQRRVQSLAGRAWGSGEWGHVADARRARLMRSKRIRPSGSSSKLSQARSTVSCCQLLVGRPNRCLDNLRARLREAGAHSLGSAGWSTGVRALA